MGLESVVPRDAGDLDGVMSLDQLVSVDPARMSGAACFGGTRMPVRTLFNWLASGATLEEFLDDFPIVTREEAEAALRIAGEVLCQRCETAVPEPKRKRSLRIA